MLKLGSAVEKIVKPPMEKPMPALPDRTGSVCRDARNQ